MTMIHQPANPWLTAAKSVATPSQASEAANLPRQGRGRPILVSEHGGAGSTPWACNSAGGDGGGIEGWKMDSRPLPVGPVVLVLRASIDGIAAAKTAVAACGPDAFAVALAVAAGPARTPRLITDELKVLAGAIPTAHAPWVPGLLLKRAAHSSPADVPDKELNKLTTTLQQHGVPARGETK